MLHQMKNSFLYYLLIAMPLSVNAVLPDPTRPANFIVEDTEPVFIEVIELDTKEKIGWRVSAIRISKEDRTAIVNGKLVRVGDEISSATIAEINPLSVIVNYEDRKLIVRLFNNLVKKEYKTSK